MITIGIDPGKSGGIAWIDERGKMCVEKMPETLADLWELIVSFQINSEGGCAAYLEQVQGGLSAGKKGRMGVTSAFSFGNGFGHLEMALTAAGIPFHRVRPQEWQKAMKCMTKGDKNVSKRRAQELFPGIKVTHAKADALLIASYGRIKNL